MMLHMDMVTSLKLFGVTDLGIGLARLGVDVLRERTAMVVLLAASFAKELHAFQAAYFNLFGGGMGGRFSRLQGRSELGENTAEDSRAFGVWPVGGGRNSSDGMNESLDIVNFELGRLGVSRALPRFQSR